MNDIGVKSGFKMLLWKKSIVDTVW